MALGQCRRNETKKQYELCTIQIILTESEFPERFQDKKIWNGPQTSQRKEGGTFSGHKMRRNSQKFQLNHFTARARKVK